MDALEKWIIIWFTPYQTTTLYQNRCSSKNFCSINLAAKWLVWHSMMTFAFSSVFILHCIPQPTAMTFAFSSVFILQCIPQPTATTFAFSSAFILLQWYIYIKPAGSNSSVQSPIAFLAHANSSAKSHICTVYFHL